MENHNFDEANVVSRSNSDVQIQTKELEPGLLYTHCLAHELELAVVDSIKIDSYLKVFDTTIKNVFTFKLLSNLSEIVE